MDLTPGTRGGSPGNAVGCPEEPHVDFVVEAAGLPCDPGSAGSRE
jgi:hypothetical protein